MADDGGAKLLVRHLPLQLNASDKEDLLKHFGAKEVICMERRGKLRDAAFAVFTDSDSAAKAVSQLHQLNVLGSRLTVEYAKVCHERLAAQQCSRVSPQRTLGDNDNKEEQKPASEHNGKEKLKSNKSGMAPGLGIDYAPNPSLHYVYPPPTASVLTNIAHTLACVPRFYVQVLHLMNRMNLPAPFGQLTPTPPLLDDTQMNPPVAVLSDDDDNITSDESEIESDEEERQKRAKQKAEIVQRLSESRSEARAKKRPGKLHLSRPSAKKAKPTASPSKQTPVEKAFEQALAQPKKIEFKLTEAISTIFESGPPLAEPTPPETEGFGMFAPALETVVENREENEEVTMEESSDFISSAELNANRMSSKEMSEMSALKNYSTGEPTCRLYLKNLAKHVKEKDLLYIFGRYVNHDLEQEKNRFDIRLMKEGRMKGQAFVTLPSEEKAKKALRDVHGFILQGKPVVIQFARSAKSKD